MKQRHKGRNVKSEKQTITKGDVTTVKASDLTKQDTPATEAKPMVIKLLKKDPKFRGAREAWFKRLTEFDGKPVDAYVKDCTDNCPQLTKNGTKENPSGWVGFFKRQGIMQEVPQA